MHACLFLQVSHFIYKLIQGRSVDLAKEGATGIFFVHSPAKYLLSGGEGGRLWGVWVAGRMSGR